jgi:hypothetical protein
VIIIIIIIIITVYVYFQVKLIDVHPVVLEWLAYIMHINVEQNYTG